MKVGDLVWNCHSGCIRFGTVTKKRKKDRWGYFTVDWHADEAHKQDVEWRKKLTGINHDLKEYRADMLKNIEQDRLVRVLKEHAGERVDEKN